MEEQEKPKKKHTRTLTHEEVLQRIQRVVAGGAAQEIDAALVFGRSLRTIRRWVRLGLLRVERVTQRTVFVDRNQIQGIIAVPLPMDDVDTKYLATKLTR